MEKIIFEKLHLHLTSNSNPHLSLASARSLLTNPNSSDSIRHAVVESLIQSLDHHRGDPIFVRHIIKILGDAAVLQRPFVASVIGTIRSLLDGGNHIAADALAVLDSLAECLVLDEDLLVLDEDLVLSLASSSIVSVRLRIIELLVLSIDGARNYTLLRPDLIVRVFLELTVDLYPSVRRAAVDGLVAVFKKDGDLIGRSMVECCYEHAVDLLWDEDEIVRSAAVRLVSECGQLFAVTEERMDGSELMDRVFVQLCSMARDMNLKVRIEAFIALGKVRLVSESVLLQSLSKKVLGSRSGRNSLAGCFIKESKLPLSCAAGAFVHGIEDEFHEVRTAACKSLGMLSIFSIQFADDALNLLMDMLNDDAAAVRLQTLQTLFHMATHDCLMVQEKHMHMFLGLLADVSPLIRHAARKVLRLMKLPELEIFISSIDGLITNLVTYPEEEEDIFSVLLFIGKKHGNFAAKRVKEFELEIVPSCDGELSLDSLRAAALLVLAISSSFSDEQLMSDIPATIFAYAVPLLGKISRSLGDLIHQDLLLAYLCHRSGMPFPAKMLKSEEAELLPHIVEEVISNYTKHADQICSSSWAIRNETSEISLKENLFDVSETSTSLQQKGKYFDDEITQSVKLILKAVGETWQLIQSQCTHKAQRVLRACKEELELITRNADGSVAAMLAFASYYVQVIQLFAELWEQLQPKKSHAIGMIALDLLLEKLDLCLRRMRYGFSGLCREEECHILELTLLGYVLRLYKVGMCSDLMLKKLHAVISHLEQLSEGGSSKLSDFAKELKRSCTQGRMSEVPQPFLVLKLLQLFRFEQIPFGGRFTLIRAELWATGNDSENPLPFVSGLPVGITFQITLYNISNKQMLWLRMAVGKSVQYVFLDLCQFEGSDGVRKCMVNLPFYATPKAASFLLRACICMECPLEDVTHCKKSQGGPRHDITLLCKENDVYLVRIGNR